VVITPRIICETCDTKHLLKITIGRENNQYHSFPCTECEEEIEVGVEDIYGETEFRSIKNCITADFDYFEAIQVHLHPDLGVSHKVVEAGDIFTATMSNIFEMQRMFDAAQQNSDNEICEHRSKYYNYNSDVIRHYLKIWSLLKNNKNKAAKLYINKNLDSESDSEDLEYYKEKLFNHLIGEYGLKIYKSLCNEAGKVTDIKNLVRFSQDNEIDAYDIFEEFTNLFKEFSQIFGYLINGIEISKSLKVSSNDFHETKKYYSSCYEAVAKILYIPAAINNAVQRGNIHKFERIDSLDKYQSLGNGDKLRCFEGNPELIVISECYDNHLRNASFHNHMAFNRKKSKISYNKNNGDYVSISYADYLVMCIKITEALAALSLYKLKLGSIES
jgi:hypothetical protein